MSEEVTKLRVGNEDFLVASTIERCPKAMMLRELLMNAVEAASRAPAGQRKVEISGVMIDEHRKLCLWNSGPGMDADQLYRMCDIASSIGKEMGLGGNFGMGAKVASLPSNRLGVRYRSCRSGVVHEVLLGKRDGIYGRVMRTDPRTGAPSAVLEVTAAAQADGRDTGSDWTEVVLFGNQPEQDTLADPYGRDPRLPRHWLAPAIYGRFFDLPADVEVLLAPGTHGLAGTRRIVPLAQRLKTCFERYEAVTLKDGIVLHFAYDPPHPVQAGRNASLDDGLVPDASLAALVHGGEIYDQRQGKQWLLEAPSFGISFGGRHISVIVELPDTAAVLPDGYRHVLRYAAGSQAQVKIGDFAGLVRANRPAWLLDLIENMSPDVDLARDVSSQVQNLMSALGVRRKRPPSRNKLQQQPPAPRIVKPSAPAPAPRPEEMEVAPEILLLRDEREIADRSLKHRAARYYQESHQLYVNLTYSAVRQTIDRLIAEAPQEIDAESAQEAARVVAEQAMLQRVGCALVFGLSKRDHAEGWSDHDRNTAISSELLTLAADDLFSTMEEMSKAFAQRLEALRKEPKMADAVEAVAIPA